MNGTEVIRKKQSIVHFEQTKEASPPPHTTQKKRGWGEEVLKPYPIKDKYVYIYV
jgi:hypothetical protein